MISGTPPRAEDCTLVELGSLPNLGRGDLLPRDDVADLIETPLPFGTIRRLLFKQYRDRLPIKVVVPNYGLLLLGEEGWSCTGL